MMTFDFDAFPDCFAAHVIARLKADRRTAPAAHEIKNGFPKSGAGSTPPRSAQAGAPAATPQGEALLKIQAVLQRTSLSKSTLYAKIKEGTFPEPVRLGARCSRWKSSELDNWLSHVGQ